MTKTETGHRDLVGAETLSVISAADQFNKWMYETIKPFLKGEILEIGSGIGNISQYVISDFSTVTLSDFNKGYISEMKKKWINHPGVKDFVSIDLQHPSFQTEYAHLKEKFDSVFLLNVIEHLKDDYRAVENCRFLLKIDGHLILLAPAYKILYSKLDKELGHFRRYTATTLAATMTNAGFRLLSKKYFNLLGTLGWLVSGKLFGNKQLGKNEMSAFNKLVPIAKFADRLVGNRAGLSAITIGKKL